MKNNSDELRRNGNDSSGNDNNDDDARVYRPVQDRTTVADVPDTTAFFDPIAAGEAKKEQKKHQNEGLGIFKKRDREPNFAVSLLTTVFRFIIVAIFIAVAVGAGCIYGLGGAYLESTPELDVTKISDQSLTSYIYDQEGNLLATYTGNENRDWATLDEIPEQLQNAVIAIEDIRFYSHNGIDIKRLLGAFVSNISSDSVEGGSTLTQQLIKNNLLTSERSYKRKLQEAYLAIQLEQNYSKEEILEYYLNNIPLGGTIYGVKAAARDYFGKELDELSLKQIACLASITKSPHTLNPRRATYVKKDVTALQERMNTVLDRMYAAGYITKEEHDENYVSKTEYEKPEYIETWISEMGVLKESPANEMYAMPHFTEYVIYDVCTHMMRERGLEDTVENRSAMEDEIRVSGYSIYATVDAEIQDTVQQTLSEWDDYPPLADGKTEIVNSDGSSTIQPQASATVIDYETGYIVALVGSRDAPSSKKTLNRAYQAGMPVGSSIKPIAVYAPAFDNGCGLVTPVANVPVAIDGWDTEKGYPLTSHGTYGPMSMRQAIVESRNIVAARTLMDYVGLEESAEYLEKQGIDEEKLNIDGVGLALGSSGLTTLDMAACYSTLANEGYYMEPISFTKVVDSDGNVVLDAEETRNEYQVYKLSSAWMTVDALIDAVDHGTGSAAQIEGIETAGKTGTVVDARGTFFAGMTGYYVSTLWIGADDYTALDASAASKVTAPLWKEYMTKIHEGKEDKSIHRHTAESAGLTEVTLCAYSGLLPGDGCQHTVTDYIAVEDVPEEHCSWCTSTKICTVSNMVATEYCPEETCIEYTTPVFPEDSPYYKWYSAGGASLEEDTDTDSSGQISADTTQTCTIHTPERNAAVSIATDSLNQADNALVSYGAYMTLEDINEINTKRTNVSDLVSQSADPDVIINASDELVNTVNRIVSTLVIPAEPY